MRLLPSIARPVFYLLLACLVTWPLVLHLPDRLLGHPDVDVWNHVWGFWWVKKTLLELARLPLFTYQLAYPRGGRLYFIDPLNALLSIPLQSWFGLAAGFNLTLLGELALVGLATHLLAREAGASETGGYLAGLSVVASPILRCEMHNGITEVQNLGWLSLSLWATHRALRTTRVRDGLLAGLCLGLAVVACWYYGMAAGLAAGLMWLMRTTWRPFEPARLLSRVPALAAFGVAALLLAVPFWGAMSWTLQTGEALIKRSPDTSHFLIRHNATDLLSFFVPGRFHSPDLWLDYGERFLHTTYLGWIALGLGVVGGRAREARAWIALAATFAVLALGPYLYLGGQFVTVGHKLITLPFAALFTGIGRLSITHPARMVTVTLLALAVLIGLGVSSLQTRFPRRAWAIGPVFGLALGLEALFMGPAPFPVPLANAEYGESTRLLAADPVPGAVLDLPGRYLNTMRTSRYLFEQTGHGRPVPYNVHVRPEATVLSPDRLYGWLLKLGQEDDPEVARQLRDVPLAELKQGFKEQLESTGFRYVVIHRRVLQEPFGAWPYRRLFDALIGPPLSTTDGCWVYRIDASSEQAGAGMEGVLWRDLMRRPEG